MKEPYESKKPRFHLLRIVGCFKSKKTEEYPAEQQNHPRQIVTKTDIYTNDEFSIYKLMPPYDPEKDYSAMSKRS
jgi:hypothetical protein